MSTDLESLFQTVSQSSDRVIEKIQRYDHPLLTLLDKELQKQQQTLRMLLDVFKQEGEEPPLDSFKEYCSIVYHSNEMASSFFTSWVRATGWTDLPSKSVVPDCKTEMEKIKKSLDEAADQMQKIYGQQAVKYVIPTFYLPA